jgi:hypothetical protein
MSTQRRANRTSPAIETDRVDVGCRWFRGCRGRTGISIPETRISSLLASQALPQRQRAVAEGPGITAPLMSIIWLAWAWFRSCDERSQASTFRVATKSLHTDHRFETFAGYESLSSSPPPGGAGGCRLPSPAKHAPVIASAHPHPPRPLASPPRLAAGPSRRSPLGGKARWQKRFVFPARRMRRGLQF